MSTCNLPLPITRALKKSGKNISAARRARGWSQEDFAQRLDTSLSTVRRLENGFHGTALHIFFRALHLLGLLDELIDLTAIENSQLGVLLLQDQLPKRIHSQRSTQEEAQRPKAPSSSKSDEELEGF